MTQGGLGGYRQRDGITDGKVDAARARPMSHPRKIGPVFRGDMGPKVVAHALEIVDVITDHDTAQEAGHTLPTFQNPKACSFR